jgi:hypothetical protein
MLSILPDRVRASLRNWKNEVIENYYSFRIETLADPYQIVGKSQRYRILFILGHMRSGSSLLTLLLNANPEIIGYGETHLKYASEKDFQRLIFKLYRKNRELKMQHKYALDKVLHNSKIINQHILASEQLSTVFLIREPQKSLASMMKIKPHWSESEIMDHYIKRLSSLENYAKLINSKQRSLFITHDQLLNNTEQVFGQLQKFLDVKIPFSEEYKVLSTTGQRGVGDSSENIKAGRILRGEDRPPSTTIDPSLVEKGWRAFEQCYATLSSYCQTIERE